MEDKLVKFNDKEVALVKRQATGSMNVAQSLIIENTEDLQKAITLLSRIKQAAKIIKEKKEEFTKPAREIIKSARELFKSLEEKCNEAEAIVKEKMIDFNDKEEAKMKKEEEKVVAKIEAGKMTLEKAAEKLDKISPEKVVESKGGKIQYRTIKEVVIDDETKIPRRYLVADMVSIRKDVLAGEEIPGVSIVEKKIVASSSN